MVMLSRANLVGGGREYIVDAKGNFRNFEFDGNFKTFVLVVRRY